MRHHIRPALVTKLARSRLLPIVFLLSGQGLYGQSAGSDTSLVLDDPTLLLLRTDSIPFTRIDILDNRFDTITFRMQESGKYPAIKETFTGSTRAAIGRYYEKVLGSVKRKGDNVLLLNITQLRIGNSLALARRAKGKGPARWEPVRFTLQFCGQAYYQLAPGKYRMIMKFDYPLYMTSEGWTANKDYLPWVLDRVLLAAASMDGKSRAGLTGMKHQIWGWGDEKYFDFNSDRSDRSIAEIDQPARQQWGSYPIVQAPRGKSGAYVNFDDFREARLSQGQIRMQLDARDSVYRLQDGPLAPVTMKVRGIKKLFFWPYAVADSSGLYINLLRKNQYLKLTPSGNTFCFRIPDSLPDMYALLSKECSRAATAGPFISVNSDNPIQALVASLAANAINDAVYRPRAHQNAGRERENSREYRNCFIDMGSGDIIYAQK